MNAVSLNEHYTGAQCCFNAGWTWRSPSIETALGREITWFAGSNYRESRVAFLVLRRRGWWMRFVKAPRDKEELRPPLRSCQWQPHKTRPRQFLQKFICKRPRAASNHFGALISWCLLSAADVDEIKIDVRSSVAQFWAQLPHDCHQTWLALHSLANQWCFFIVHLRVICES